MFNTQRIRAVLFDMDGVLVDVSGSYRRAIEETAAFFTGKPVPPGAVQAYKNRGGYNDDWKLTAALIADAGVEVPYVEVVREFQLRYQGVDWDGFITSERALFTHETLAKLADAGMTMGVVTGRPEDEARWAIRHFGWQEFFPVLVSADRQDGRGKPDPYGLQLALADLALRGENAPPEEAVYVGDTVDDMVAARAADMGAIGVVPPYLDFEANRELLLARGAHLVLRQTAELPAAVGL